jgi:hypothetical protein
MPQNVQKNKMYTCITRNSMANEDLGVKKALQTQGMLRLSFNYHSYTPLEQTHHSETSSSSFSVRSYLEELFSKEYYSSIMSKVLGAFCVPLRLGASWGYWPSDSVFNQGETSNSAKISYPLSPQNVYMDSMYTNMYITRESMAMQIFGPAKHSFLGLSYHSYTPSWNKLTTLKHLNRQSHCYPVSP